MKWLQVVLYVSLAGPLAMRATAAERDAAQPNTIPPVLRSSEPSDDAVVVLPGAPVPPKRAVVAPPAPAAVAAPTLSPSAPVPVKRSVAPLPPPPQAKIEPVPPRLVETATTRFEPRKPPLAPAIKAPEPRAAEMDKEKKAKPALPPGFAKDSAAFCQKQISLWKEADARSLLGAPLRQRPALGDDKKSVNGRIYAFSDPSGRYKELELDFDTTGKLRTVFGYPPQMTWKECLRLWGNNVSATDARQGRTFYSYLNRRLDVLVDPKGNVISVGLY